MVSNLVKIQELILECSFLLQMILLSLNRVMTLNMKKD